jgi:DNA-binding CsgD family transcriptional regulator
MKAILGQLGARSRTHALRIALERGLLDAAA